MRVLLCVEGSHAFNPGQAVNEFDNLWIQTIGAALGGARHELALLPLNKGNLVAASGAPVVGAAPFQVLLAAAISRSAAEAVVVIWDLVPPWAPDAPTCRWNECIALLRAVADDPDLAAPWRDAAARLLQEYEGRPQHAKQSRQSRVTANGIELVCIHMEFESLLLVHEGAVREALGLRGQRIREWPRWPASILEERDPKAVVAQAVRLADRAVRRRVRGDMRTNPHGWAAHLLSSILASEQARAALDAHPAWDRLRQLLS
jgi:hypothetical protein